MINVRQRIINIICRSGDFPKKFSNGFKGYLHVDGYAGYHKLEPGVKLSACWAHVRRKFDEALAVLPEKNPQSAAAIENNISYL
jgi:transposase